MSITREGWEQMQRQNTEALQVAIEACAVLARGGGGSLTPDDCKRYAEAAATLRFKAAIDRGEIIF
jgi:hypothetical protein